MAAWSGDSCNSLLKMLQATLNDYNESSYPIISSIEAMSCEVFVAHQGIYVKCVSVIVYVHNFLLDKTCRVTRVTLVTIIDASVVIIWRQ